MEPVIGEKKGKYMKKLKNSELIEGTFGLMRPVRDFLPKPEDLVFKEKQVKVTMKLTHKSLNFFKNEAVKHGASYQAMIRNLLDYYVAQQ